jgi:drug/metabolite transporter (DMT)-like permease
MEIGLLLSVFAAAGFAAATVLVRKAAAQAGESFTAAAIGNFIGVPFFVITLFITGEWSTLMSVSVRALILFGLAGILHFVLGRTLVYNGVRLIGANKTTPFINTNIFYAVILGILFLKEPFTVWLIPGVLCIFIGAVLIRAESKSVVDDVQKGRFGTEVTGILYTLGGAICWGVSPVIIRMAIGEVGSPFVGAFISYVAASVVSALIFLHRQPREQLLSLPLKTTILTLAIGGFFASCGQLLRYVALVYSPASLVTPIIGTSGLFILIFSFFINRQTEVFTPKVIIGMVAAVVGIFLMFQ